VQVTRIEIYAFAIFVTNIIMLLGCNYVAGHSVNYNFSVI